MRSEIPTVSLPRTTPNPPRRAAALFNDGAAANRSVSPPVFATSYPRGWLRLDVVPKMEPKLNRRPVDSASRAARGVSMIMKSVSARFDEGRVLFDEEIVIPRHARLLVTILEESDTDRGDFLTLSSTTFADAYGDDEVEYSAADLRR